MALYKKYRRCVNVGDGIDTALVIISMGLDVGSVSLFSTIIAASTVDRIDRKVC